MTTTSTANGVQHVELRSGAYADSVALLQVSKDVAGVAGVQAAQVAMGTELNLEVIASMGFTLPESSPNDMIIALRCDSEEVIASAVAAVDVALAAATKRQSGGGEEQAAARTTASALKHSQASLAMVSVPGANAAVEAMDALDNGHDVMIFSDNMPLEQEIALKHIGHDRGLLVMGPDCGTAMIDGVGLGFANSVRPGPVGIVAASGTGCQQLMCLLDFAGLGMNAALGVGGRDVSAEVGGLATREAMRRLDADPATELIVVVSKPPADEVADQLRSFATELDTPVHFALLGAGQPDLTMAAEAVLAAAGHAVPNWPTWGAGDAAGSTNSAVREGFIRGLFVGGTLCDEAMLIAAAALGPIHSNIPFEAAAKLDATLTANAHLMIDFGDDALTGGRAHPMIDPSLRLEHLDRAVDDSHTALILMDVVLGHGAEADPAASLAPAIASALARAHGAGRDIAIVIACVGTESDPQNLQRQAAALADAGAEVFLSNAQAVHRALSLIGAQS